MSEYDATPVVAAPAVAAPRCPAPRAAGRPPPLRELRQALTAAIGFGDLVEAELAECLARCRQPAGTPLHPAGLARVLGHARQANRALALCADWARGQDATPLEGDAGTAGGARP